MAIRKIVYLPEEVLRRKAKKVTSFDADFQTLVDDMIDTMRDAPGVGLAAPQVGESLRLVVVEYGEGEEDDAPKKLYVLVNPEFIQHSEEMEDGVEACLSVPGLAGEVSRWKRVLVKAQNRRGQTVKIRAAGWLARIFQHEIDHLDGIIFTDRAAKVWQPTADEADLLRD
jgi:peptide deformylase